MSIIITGLEMPTERESFNLTIKYNGTVLDTETDIQVAEAYELLPHGRTIDADVLSQMFDPDESFGAAVLEIIADTPTIIPAEPSEEQREYEAQVEAAQYCEMYEPSYDPETGAL